MPVTIIDPRIYLGYDDLLLTAEQATFFHTSAWARVLSGSYGYKPLYFAIIDSGKLAGLIPVMEIDSFLTGKRGVSLPFTDFCQPIADTVATFQVLMHQLTEYGQQAGWKYVEFRGGIDFFKGAPNCEEHFVHILDLDGSEDSLFKSFRESTRRYIRKAEKEGVAVSLLHTREAVTAFYALHCRTRQRYGLPPQPWAFFLKIFAHIIGSKWGLVALAEYQGKPVAAAVYFLFRDCALYKFGASDRRFQHLRANNLVMWEAIRWFCRNGFRSLHFGRTEPANEGLLQFKRGWRPADGKLAYYRYDLKAKRFPAGKSKLKTSYEVFKMLPVPMLRIAGNLLYRHVG
jgi:hypothetical protein